MVDQLFYAHTVRRWLPMVCISPLRLYTTLLTIRKGNVVSNIHENEPNHTFHGYHAPLLEEMGYIQSPSQRRVHGNATQGPPISLRILRHVRFVTTSRPPPSHELYMSIYITLHFSSAACTVPGCACGRRPGCPPAAGKPPGAASWLLLLRPWSLLPPGRGGDVGPCWFCCCLSAS